MPSGHQKHACTRRAALRPTLRARRSALRAIMHAPARRRRAPQAVDAPVELQQLIGREGVSARQLLLGAPVPAPRAPPSGIRASRHGREGTGAAGDPTNGDWRGVHPRMQPHVPHIGDSEVEQLWRREAFVHHGAVRQRPRARAGSGSRPVSGGHGPACLPVTGHGAVTERV
jgi:hypothetical protein